LKIIGDDMLTTGMNTDQIIELAKTRAEPPWHWGIFLDRTQVENFAKPQGLIVKWNEPIRPGNWYLGKRNTGFHLL
jgi:hypothetical protein